MPGRLTLYAEPALLAETFGLLREPKWTSSYNIAPCQPTLVIRQGSDGGRTGDPVRWGLIPRWAKDAAIGSDMINARSESVATKPTFQEAFRQRRCLVVANGYYEWQVVTSRVKQPWYLFRTTGELLTFAAVWESWKDPEGEEIETCAILTTEPNAFVAPLHHRMGVILPPEALAAWLDPSINDPQVLQRWLVPCPDDWLSGVTVSSLVNHPRNNSPECIKPVKLSRGLFD